MIMNPDYQDNKTGIKSPEGEKRKILTFLREHSIRESSGLEKNYYNCFSFRYSWRNIFLSSNITGNIIADLTIKTSSFLGVGFFWFKEKNK